MGLKKKTLIVAVVSCLLASIAVLGTTYAIYVVNLKGDKTQQVSSGTLNVEFQNNSSAISLTNAYPMTDEDGLKNEGIMPGPMKVRRRAKQMYEKLDYEHRTLNDPLAVLDWVNAFAFAANEENACGGRVVTAPTNGAAGVIPAVLHYYMKFIDSADINGVRNFLLTAGQIGILYKENASISGAEVGCQGEVGVACSMASGGLAQVLGATPEQVENAAEIGMEHHLGMTCDPVAGQVQIPCIERNAVAAVKAINAARLALMGDGHHYVSLDQVIVTMLKTGLDLQMKYKETSRGGLAVSVVEC